MQLIHLANLLAILFDVGLLTIYFHIFFPRKRLPKLVLITVYGCATAIYYCSANYLPEAYQKMAVYLCVCLFLSYCYQGPVIYKMLLTLIYASIGVMMETVVTFLLTMVDEHIYGIAGTSLGYILGIGLSTLLFFLTLCAVWYVLRKRLNITDISKCLVGSYWVALFLILVLVTIAISQGFNYLTIKQGIRNGLLYFFILECLLLIFGVAIFFIFRELEQLQQEKLQAIFLKQQNEAQEAFYKESIARNQRLKKLAHDDKNFLLGLVGLLQNGQTEAAMEAIEQKVEQLVSNVTDYTGLISLDTVLTAKADEAAQAGILLRPAAALYGEICVDLLDLAILLGNGLDNAIEATKQLDNPENKMIHVTLKLQDEFLSVEVRNPVKEKPVIRDNCIETTKKDGNLHGFGIENMKRLTEKYNGTLLLDCSDTTFVLKILLENPCELQNG